MSWRHGTFLHVSRISWISLWLQRCLKMSHSLVIFFFLKIGWHLLHSCQCFDQLYWCYGCRFMLRAHFLLILHLAISVSRWCLSMLILTHLAYVAISKVWMQTWLPRTKLDAFLPPHRCTFIPWPRPAGTSATSSVAFTCYEVCD